VADKLDGEVLYISGEESAEQIKMRLDRLGLSGETVKYLGETDILTSLATIEKEKPALAIIDSIQTMTSQDAPSEAGSINQVRVCTVKLLELAKRTNIPIFIIGHVTKEGTVAGPKTLEHLVDTVIYLEGDSMHLYRLLRTAKNRFGSTNEVGIFTMEDKGLVEVKNPSQIFLEGKEKNEIGSAVTALIEGSRSILVEVQALVTKTSFGYPQRRSSGFDLNRMLLIIAVLNKRLGLNLGTQDIHLNVAGGIKIKEPAADLAAALAIISAFKNKPLPNDLAAIGEIGLTGEVRTVNQIEKRIQEALKLGFKKIILPKNIPQIKTKCELITVNNLKEVEKII